jgi:hypothetical protein
MGQQCELLNMASIPGLPHANADLIGEAVHQFMKSMPRKMGVSHAKHGGSSL